MSEIRLLRADEIDVRVAQINEKGATLLLYKDARVDMNILDEVYGAGYWQREHQMIGDRLYCTIKVWNKELNQWIAKQDVGTESYTEKEKGQASDSFKRAGFNVGIGRELYTAPFTWVSKDKIEMKQNNGKWSTYDKFSVKEIQYNDNREICKLVIVNQKGNEVFRFGNDAPVKEVPITDGTLEQIDILVKEYAEVLGNKTEADIMQVIRNNFRFSDVKALTDNQGKIVINTIAGWIAKTRKKNEATA